MNLKQYIRDTVKEYITVFKNKFASVNGSSTIAFSVKNPTSGTHAINLNTGNNRYLGKSNKATDSNKLDGKTASSFANKNHTHAVNDIGMLSTRLGDLEKFHSGASYTLHNYYYWRDDTSRSYSTSWGGGYTTPYIYCHARTRFVEFHFHILSRNDSSSWGGLKMELFVSIDDGAWQSVGIDHHGGNIMQSGSTAIGTHTNFYKLPLSSGASKVRFYFRHASFDGTTYVNQGGVSGAFFSSFIAKEYRTVY